MLRNIYTNIQFILTNKNVFTYLFVKIIDITN